MPKITVVGAGSVGFTQKLVRDVLGFEELRESHIALLDIDPERLDTAYQWCERLKEQEHLPATFSAHTDRREALEGADYVMCVILANGVEPFENEVNLPFKYGITQPVGDTLCVGGIFRALRTIPIMVDICHDMEQVCPDAWMLNYTNPMHMVTWACRVASRIKFLGLCHGVQGTAGEMAGHLGLQYEDVRYWVAGINHMAWFLRFESAAGEDLYPRLWEAVAGNPECGERSMRWDFARQVGYYMTESDGHFSEYVPYYRKRPDLLEQWDHPGTFAGGHAMILHHYQQDWRETAGQTFRHIRGEVPIPFGERSMEYAASIILAMETNRYFRLHGNVLNHGLISNLPAGCCVEVPCFVDRLGVHPCAVGDLPPQCAALNLTNVSVHTLAVQAALEGDREKAFHAVLYDPLTAAMLSPREIRAMFDELFEANRKFMPQFG